MALSINRTAVCLQHVPFEGPAIFEKLLLKRNYAVEKTLVPEAGLPSDAGDFLLVMGGPMSVNDKDPWIEREIQFIQHAVLMGVPFLGICLGSQLLAKALGGRVYSTGDIELGMTAIALTPEGERDPAFSQLPPITRVLEWHGEAVAPPECCAILATSDRYPVQAFRYGDFAYGVLFHAEMEMEHVELICANCPEDLAKAGRSAEDVMHEAKEELPGLNEWAKGLLDHLLV